VTGPTFGNKYIKRDAVPEPVPEPVPEHSTEEVKVWKMISLRTIRADKIHPGSWLSNWTYLWA
jgi:hypothetical protein